MFGMLKFQVPEAEVIFVMLFNDMTYLSLIFKIVGIEAFGLSP